MCDVMSMIIQMRAEVMWNCRDGLWYCTVVWNEDNMQCRRYFADLDCKTAVRRTYQEWKRLGGTVRQILTPEEREEIDHQIASWHMKKAREVITTPSLN
jgi:hypothetical protein